MTDEIDIWRSAKLLLEQHGQDADLLAAARIDDMIAVGDAKGEMVWRRVLAAVKKLQQDNHSGGSVH